MGPAGVASLPSLTALRTGVLPLGANYFDPARETTGYFMDSTTGAATAQAGYAVTGFIPANSGGSMVFNTAIPAYTVTTGDPLQSTTSNLISSNPSAWTTNILINANTGAVESHSGYQESPYIVVTPGAAYTLNTEFQGGNWGPVYYDASKTFIVGDATQPTCGSAGPVGGGCRAPITFTVPSTSTIHYVRYGLQDYGTAGGLNSGVDYATTYCPSQESFLAGTTFPAAGSCPPAFAPATTAMHSNGIAEFDQNQAYLRGVAGPLAAGTAVTLGSDVGFIRAGFAGDPSATLMACYGASCPGSYTAFVGAQSGVSSSSVLLAQLWPAMAGLYAWLPFTDNTGASVTDATGNGNNGVIGGSTATPAAWLGSVGLAPGSQTVTIANANGRPVNGVCGYFPAANANAYSTYSVMGGAAVSGQASFQLNTSYGVGTDHGYDAFFPEYSQSSGSAADLAVDGISGAHCIELVAGVSGGANDMIVIDGQPATYQYQSNAASAWVGGAQLTNSVVLQGNGSSPASWPVILYSAWIGGSRDTLAQAEARTASEMARLAQRGVQFGVSAGCASTASVGTFTGTSIDYGFMASHAPSTLLALDYPITLTNFAVSGQAPKDMAAGYQDREGGPCVYHPLAAKNIAYNGGPTNGVVNYQESPANAFVDTLAWIHKAHAQGYKVCASTMISRCGTTGYGGQTGDALKQAYNALLLADGDEADWVVNQAAAPQLGADNACANATYFADASGGLGTHPNDTGQAYYVAAERACFEGVYGNPLTHVSGNYTQVDSDRLLVQSATSASTITLKDANYASFNKAGKLCVKNLGTATTTLTPVNSETINGASTLAVAAGSTACVVPYVASMTTAGANWITVQP